MELSRYIFFPGVGQRLQRETGCSIRNEGKEKYSREKDNLIAVRKEVWNFNEKSALFNGELSKIQRAGHGILSSLPGLHWDLV